MKDILDNDLFRAFGSASNHVYIYVCDMKTNISRWSQNAVEYFSMPGEYMEGADQVWLERIHPEDRERYLEDIHAVFSGERDRHRCEYRAMNQYGDYVWVECRGSMLRGDDGQPRLFAGMMTRLDARNKYDPVTNLKTFFVFNHYDFSKGNGTVLLIGIDAFREVINNFGYSFGDAVLYEFAQRVLAHCRGKHYVYRMEGDEFLIVSPGGDRDGAARLFQELKGMADHLGGAFNYSISLSLSGGCAVYPDDGNKREELLSNLEHSMEHAKKHARGSVVFFSRAIAEQHSRAIRLKQLLSQSVRDGCKGFQIYYQPIVDNGSNRAVCCEALLRWFNNEVENVSVGEVVRFLENSGEIHEVGCFVAEEVFKQAKKWQEEYGDFMVGFNTSYLQFQQKGFAEYLIALAEKYGVDPSLISIELTESSHVEDFAGLAKDFRRLRRAGFKMSLDDFGIAYSTFLLIRNLPVDSVKIDHSFVRNLAPHNEVDLAIVESIAALCRKLGLDVVVEGIETKEILDIVRQFPVTLFQGYYFEKPVPAERMEALIHHGF